MNIDLRTALPMLLPSAIRWAEVRASEVAQSGSQLNENRISIARAVGVIRPELIRVALVDRLPLPEEPQLRTAALQTGLLGPGTEGRNYSRDQQGSWYYDKEKVRTFARGS